MDSYVLVRKQRFVLLDGETCTSVVDILRAYDCRARANEDMELAKETAPGSMFDILEVPYIG